MFKEKEILKELENTNEALQSIIRKLDMIIVFSKKCKSDNKNEGGNK